MLVTFLWLVWLTYKAMVFTKEDRILIKVFRVTVPESCWRNFLTRASHVQHWTNFCGIDWRYRVCRQEVRQHRERTVCTRDMQMYVQMATTLSTNCNWWCCVRTAKATFPYWKLLFFSFIFLNGCCSKTVQWILLKFATFAPERW